MDLLAIDPRWTALCTNGTLIPKRIESLNRISSHLEISISLDGFQHEHDMLRGSGSHRRAIEGLRLLLHEKKAGRYLGEVTVNFVVSGAMVQQLFSFAESLDREGIDTLYISFPWHISCETAAKMDRYFSERFAWQTTNGKPSWHSFDFRISLDQAAALNAGIARINAARWRMKLRYNPQLEPHEITSFLAGSDIPAQGKTRCNAVRSRLDVFPNGDVISCKGFPRISCRKSSSRKPGRSLAQPALQ
jgi:sulfatase maturation enzyme AslB (radical SAM superfamily)